MKILLVKLSSLGDVVHALPVVQDILVAMPDAQIDWVLEKSFAPLLSRHAGLHRVIPCEIRRWRKSIFSAVTHKEWRDFKADLQREKYDAVIDLQGLTKSALVARLAKVSPGGKRFALANQTEGSGYEAPTRWVADVAIAMEPHIHAVQRSRELAARALGYTPLALPDFGLKTRQAADVNANRQVALVHGTSRADKEWPLDHWVELGRRLQAAGYQPVLAHGSQKEMDTSLRIAAGLNNAVVWPVLGLDALTDRLAQCAGVIGVDSGVSHIAVALDLPHVQIYNFDTSWRTGPLPAAAKAPRQLSVFAKPQPTVDSVWQAWLACTEGAS
ncbi:MAG: lipopolysaccharide heptosyltransferase I [Polaromonas sp.]|uniref:lipopolysaccharide heptosyltransferase I n=1 Tax=Polaromonas sp. TaxID=1869339 RepID=UPI0025D5F29C|nr:lipopolysaccharide heptosyltransferase I [Polaromonas sp.]MBI2726903.1 lipopolysaccharide heptosyltransferase I [Polaromonas sp.]